MVEWDVFVPQSEVNIYGYVHNIQYITRKVASEKNKRVVEKKEKNHEREKKNKKKKHGG